MNELSRSDAGSLAAMYRARTTDPVEVLDACLARIAAVDDAIGAWTHVADDAARADARRLADELRSGTDRGPLHGIPVGIKETFDVAGCPADYGSEVLAGRVADSDAVVVARLRAAGAVIVGTTRSHEFAWGITTQHATRGSTANPWDLSRIPGGSSGGSAAAVAAGMVPIAIGSDTGGSVRIPAVFCGVLGLKASAGRIPRTGLVPLAPSLDTVGPLARSAADTWATLAAVAGADPGDPIADGGPPLGPEPETMDGSRPLRVGVATDSSGPPLAPGAHDALRTARAALVELGAEIVDLDMPAASEYFDVYGVVQPAEAHHTHADTLGLWPARRADYGPDVAGRLAAAADIDLRDYLRGVEHRRHLTRLTDDVLTGVDVLLSPVTAVAPSTVDDPDTADHPQGPMPLRTGVMTFTVPQSVTGRPALAVPVGLDDDGLPTAVQLTAGRWEEATAVAVGGRLHGLLHPHGPRFPG